jgi:hypothetical protein
MVSDSHITSQCFVVLVEIQVKKSQVQGENVRSFHWQLEETERAETLFC